MKARELVALSAESFEIREVDLPELGPLEIAIESEFGAAKHGTEVAGVKGYAGARGTFDPETQVFMPPVADPIPSGPRPVGNMIVGRVIAIGSDVTMFAIGDRVVAHSPFRDRTLVSAGRAWQIPDTVDWKTAVCLDPADFALAAIRDGNVRVGDAVAVFGMGAIGLMAIQIARVAGAGPIIAVDPIERRRNVAADTGATHVLDPTLCDAGLEIKRLTGNRGADVAVEHSGSMPALQAALRCVAFGGTVVAGAFPAPYGPGLDLGAEAHLNRPNIVFTRAVSDPNRDHPRWDDSRLFATCWDLFERGEISGELVVTPVVEFEELTTEYPKIMSDPAASVKLGCRFG